MKKMILDGKVVGVIDEKNFSKNELLRIPLINSEKSQFYCDFQGNIYRYDLLKKKMVTITANKRKNRKNVGVSIFIDKSGISKRYLVKYLVALAVFPTERVDVNKIGHIDGNPLNNKVSNLYLDLTIKEIDKSFY